MQLATGTLQRSRDASFGAAVPSPHSRRSIGGGCENGLILASFPGEKPVAASQESGTDAGQGRPMSQWQDLGGVMAFQAWFWVDLSTDSPGHPWSSHFSKCRIPRSSASPPAQSCLVWTP